MPVKRNNVRAEALSQLAEEFGVSVDTLKAWMDQTTMIGMIKVGWNPFTMGRVFPPSVVSFLRKRWGAQE